ncbi:hypothetical protein K469DRAFT_651493 [Zopfia rhizophila CBS 207.26]|uniref:Heme oxygenase-like protein n=1 Tax=Zopfia rhizophila CBS 207.26 TaxID=1314779 RepID=A0A6A6EQ07_9PEZI|nr:hypothetical protein K469DRAFT_651493 [Zopfia rhizophila CBS 207.26]
MISHYYFVLLLAVLLPAVFYYFGLSKKRDSFASTSNIQAATSQDVKNSRSKSRASKPTQWYRNLFFQLQHLEDHPAVLEPARDELLAMFSRAVSLALEQPQGSILPIEHYDAKRVWSFIEDEHEKVLTKWGSYLERRKQGQDPELFATAEAAKAWLVQQAPVKFVDGAWLAHMHKITTPFALRSVTKDAWQVLSEELGDGDLSKHHVYLYRQLLEDIGCPLPDGHSAEFIKPCHWDRVDNRDAWEAAVGQLLISLFPNEFLPEILGFNMHYELITLDTMRAAHELKALGINPYYFLIHISIDNADSGHTAMATHTVTRYLDMVRATEGEAALEQAWKRVQVGYTLSQALGGSLSHERESSSSAVTGSGFAAPNIPLDPLSARVIDIFKAKASVSHKFHCQSRARIGGQTLAEWLAPSMWTHPHPRQHLKLLTALSQAKPWIYPGASRKSLLVRELSWEGRMFGAFTHNEVVALTAWIDSLGPENNAWLYWSFTRRKPLASKDAVGELQDPVRHHPVVMPCDADKTDTGGLTTGSQESDSDSALRIEQHPLTPPSNARLPDVIALWFAHIGLLENTINTPSRTASPLYASIVRLLRAQAGFAIETHIVAAMDEMKRLSCPSLVDIGLELIFRAGWATSAKPSCLQDVFLLTGSQGQGDESAGLAHDMLRWGARPSANLGLLLGLALAFLELKDAIARAPRLLGQESRLVLGAIVARERQSLEECARELRSVDGAQYKQLIRGYQFGRGALENCL